MVALGCWYGCLVVCEVRAEVKEQASVRVWVVGKGRLGLVEAAGIGRWVGSKGVVCGVGVDWLGCIFLFCGVGLL